MSFANYLILVSRGESPFVAIPIFPSRFFRHGFVWVRRDGPVARPEDLKGRRVGIQEYRMTAAVWLRGAFEDDYGLRPEDVHWFQGGVNQPTRPSRLDAAAPEGITLTQLPGDRTLNDMLLAGELDAVITARYPQAFIDGDPAVRRLFPDYAAVERDYFARTGNFPIMHCVVLRRDVYEAHPWLASSLYKAFVQAKALCLAELGETGALPLTLPWLVEHLEQARAALGDDFWPYGFERNRHDIQTLIGYARRQRLLARDLTPEELFAPSTLHGSRM